MLPKTTERPPSKTQVRLRPQGMWTYEDWLHFPNDGWKYEIIDGELHMTPPPGTGHQRTSVRLVSRMNLYVEDNNLGEILEAPCGVRLPNQSVPLEPDIFFVRKDNLHIIKEKEVVGVPDLVIEILSPSSVGYDRNKKFAVYQAAGVPEYWLINYLDKIVEIFVLIEDAYTLAATYQPGDTLTSRQLPGFKVTVETLFNF